MPQSPETREQLKTLYNALTDRVLEPGAPVYVAHVNAHSAWGSDVVEETATEIEWQEGGGVCLFTGQRGTGKNVWNRRPREQLLRHGPSRTWSS